MFILNITVTCQKCRIDFKFGMMIIDTVQLGIM